MNEAALRSTKNYIIGAFNERFRMHNGLARNGGYVQMEDLECAVDLQGIVFMLEWEI